MKVVIKILLLLFSHVTQAGQIDPILSYFESQFRSRSVEVKLEDVRGRELRCLLVSAVPGRKLRGSFTMKVSEYLGFDQVDFAFNSGSSIADFVVPDLVNFEVSLEAAPNYDLQSGVEIRMLGANDQSDYFQEWSISGQEFLKFSGDNGQQSFIIASAILKPSSTLGNKYVLYYAKCN